MAHRSGGVDAAVGLVKGLAGSQFDPQIAERVSAEAVDMLGDLDGSGAWDAVIAAAPTLARPLSGDELDEALGAIADFVDLKSPYMPGHARGVAQLVDGASAELHFDGRGRDDCCVGLRSLTGWVDLACRTPSGTSGVPLGAGEWERVRLHPYMTGRMLQQSAALNPIGELAAQGLSPAASPPGPRSSTGSAGIRGARGTHVEEATANQRS